ncbi:MAG: methionyl-tRNA formyltransferase [Thermonemataceae bacterium]
MRIVFMGTPEFAVPSLRILVAQSYDVVGVITAPDKPAGRGNQVRTSAVKAFALANNLPLLQPTNLKEEAFLSSLRALKADLQVVVAFRMLPEIVWNMPPLGTFNLHASLLPKYRGAAPINWAIIRGEKETGVTTFFLQHDIDTGNIIFQEKEAIEKSDTVGTLYERLKQKGAQLVLKTVKAIEARDYPNTPQEGEVTQAPKIFRETCKIDWSQPRKAIYNLVRGLSPYPAAWTTLQGKNCKVYEVDIDFTPTQEQPTDTGGWISDDKTYLAFKAIDGWVALKELKLEGKKRLQIEDFLRGFKS